MKVAEAETEAVLLLEVARPRAERVAVLLAAEERRQQEAAPAVPVEELEAVALRPTGTTVFLTI